MNNKEFSGIQLLEYADVVDGKTLLNAVRSHASLQIDNLDWWLETFSMNGVHGKGWDEETATLTIEFQNEDARKMWGNKWVTQLFTLLGLQAFGKPARWEELER